MRKFLFILLVGCVSASAFGSEIFTKNAQTIESQTTPKLKAEAKPYVDIYYTYYLHNDGCYYLYRVYDFGAAYFEEPVDKTQYAGTTSFCPYTMEIDDMC